MISTKKPTDILKEEHQDVLQKLTALEDVIRHLDRKEEISSKIRELASFFETDFWVHFDKEETALFPEVEKFSPKDGGPLGVMLEEHEDLRNTNRKFQLAIGTYLRDDNASDAKAMIQTQGRHFIWGLRDHISKEDGVLFMMADMHLNQDQVDKVSRLFLEIEKSNGRKG